MSQPVVAVPAVRHQGEGNARWFLGALSTIKASAEDTAGRVAITENWVPRGHGSPLHVHHNEDEWFYILSGELTFWIDGDVTIATAGALVYGPRDVPHTFTVSSDEARFLLVVEPAGFERTSSSNSQNPPNRTRYRPPLSSHPHPRR